MKKVLIWIGCFLCLSLFITGLRTKSGIILGGLPTALLYSGTFWLVNYLCKKVDIITVEKEARSKGMSIRQYVESIVPPTLMEFCKINKDNKKLIKENIVKFNEAQEDGKNRIPKRIMLVLLDTNLFAEVFTDDAKNRSEEVPIIEEYKTTAEKELTNNNVSQITNNPASIAPNGFVFSRPETSTIPKNNVSIPISNATRKNLPSDKLVLFTNITSIVLTIISMLSVIIAMNVQDIERNYYENWNTTTVYIILLLIFGAFLGFAINSLVQKGFKLISCLSTVPVIAMIITTVEGSIMAGENFQYTGWYYYNSDVVFVLNVIWIVCIVLVLFIAFIPVLVFAIKKINNHWHKSVSYREKCYKRVAKIHSYLEKGIITEAEYEKTKSDILKYIE